MQDTGVTPILIKSGQIVNEDSMRKADVLCVDGKISQIGDQIHNIPNDVRIIEANGKMVIPGGIDPHTHLEAPFMGTVTADDYLTGTQAALAGGTTMIIDFVYTGKGKSLIDEFLSWKNRAEPAVCCDFALSVAVPDWNEHVASEMEVLVRNHGVNSFKFFTAYKGRFMLQDQELYQAFKQCKSLGALPRIHCENGDVIAEKEKELVNLGVTGPEGHLQARPEPTEAEATGRACMIANQANVPLYVVHVNSPSAALAIAKARNEGAVVFGEALAAAVGVDGTHMLNESWVHAAGYVCSPPLRPNPNSPKILMDLLTCGELQTTGSDNCTFNTCQRALGKDDFTKIPNGINGLEDRMSVVWEKGVHTGAMDPMRFVAVTSSNTAKYFNIYPQKGRIDLGSDADIVIWNPNETRTISAKTHHQAVDFNIFEGMTCHGVPEMTIQGGRVVWENGKMWAIPGSGRYLPLPPFSAHVYSCIEQREKVRMPIRVEREPYLGPVIQIGSSD